MKKTLFLLLALLTASLSATAYDFMVGGLCYNINEDGSSVTVTFEQYEENSLSPAYSNLSGDVIIPSSVAFNGDTYRVSAISDYAFFCCYGITSVTIGNSVETIGFRAFYYCRGLISATIGISVGTISSQAFLWCWNLETVNWNAESCYINFEYNVFRSPFAQNEKISSFIFGNTVEYIPSYICRGLSGLTSVTIGNSVELVGPNAFEGCINVKTLNYRAGLLYNNLQYNSLYGMTNVEVVNFDEDAMIVPPDFLKNFPNLQEVNIGSSVTTIYQGAFNDCGNLKKLGYNALNTQTGELSISSLKRLTIGENVSSIPSDKAFYNCNNLQMILFNGNNPPTLASHKVFPEGSFLTIKNKSAVNNYKYKYNSLYTSAGYSDAPLLPWSLWELKLQSLGGYSASAIAYGEDIGNDIFSEAGFILDGNKRFKTSTINKNTEDGYMSYSVNNIPNLIPGKTYKIEPYIIVDGIEYRDIYGGNLIIPNVVNSYDYSIAPSSIILKDKTSFPNGLSYKGSKLTLNNISYDSYGNDIVVTGLRPNNYYSGTYSVMLSDGSCSVVDCGFNTPSLTLNNQAVKMLTNSTAMLQAYTNLSEEETSCGFNWKRYDAPDEMLGNPVYCPVYDGMMMGTLKNLPEGVYYKYRPFYRASDGTLYYGEWVAFYTGDANVQFEPVAHTYDNARVSGTQSIIQGIAIRGSQEITEQGFEYWIDNTKAANGEDIEDDVDVKAGTVNKVTATGERMSATLENLKGGTTYAFRAYVKTASGTTYGELRNFHTPVLQANGDVNGDGHVSSVDVTALYNYLLNGDTSNIVNGDQDGDGKITAVDITIIYNILLGNQ